MKAKKRPLGWRLNPKRWVYDLFFFSHHDHLVFTLLNEYGFPLGLPDRNMTRRQFRKYGTASWKMKKLVSVYGILVRGGTGEEISSHRLRGPIHLAPDDSLQLTYNLDYMGDFTTIKPGEGESYIRVGGFYLVFKAGEV